MLLVRGNNGYANAPEYDVINILPILLSLKTNNNKVLEVTKPST